MARPHGHEFDQITSWFRDYDTEASILTSLLARHRGPVRTVVELGCGTGNLLQRMAAAGDYDLWGLDCDPDMLSAAGGKVAPSDRVHLAFSDVTSRWAVPAPAQAAYAPFSLFTNFFPRPVLHRAFSAARAGLAPGGLLILNGFCPLTLARDFLPSRFLVYGVNPVAGNTDPTYVRVVAEGAGVRLIFYHRAAWLAAPRIVDHYLHPYSPERLAAVGSRFGFTALDIRANSRNVGTFVPGSTAEYWLTLEKRP